jgi:hypothetical protein
VNKLVFEILISIAGGPGRKSNSRGLRYVIMLQLENGEHLSLYDGVCTKYFDIQTSSSKSGGNNNCRVCHHRIENCVISTYAEK